MRFTKAEIYFNGAMVEYYFPCSKKEFESTWDNHIPAVGYVGKVDVNGNHIYINPSNCGAIKISEVERKVSK